MLTQLPSSCIKVTAYLLEGALWLKTINEIGHYENSHSIKTIYGKLLKSGMKQVFDSVYQTMSKLDNICLFLVNY